MDAIDSVFDPLREFAKDSVRLVKRCHKPDRKGTSSQRSRFVQRLASSSWDSLVSSSSSSLSPSITSSSDLARQLRPQKEQAGQYRRMELDQLFQILTNVIINLKSLIYFLEKYKTP
uniref:Uncharacterized protein n=1 Tax=Cucumis sativus TaxID=3659 RepID=A0A0A0LXS8_CUCSA